MAGVLFPMLQPGPATTPGATPRPRERLLAVFSPAVVAAAVLVLGLHLPPFLSRLLGEAAARIGGAP